MPQPESIYALEDFKHAKPDLNYFKTQKFIQEIQGQNNLWFAGLYTHDIDAHESAIVSAIKIAKQLNAITEEIRNHREEENFVENDIDRLRMKINEIQRVVEQFSRKDATKSIMVVNKEIDWNQMIYIQEIQQLQEYCECTELKDI